MKKFITTLLVTCIFCSAFMIGCESTKDSSSTSGEKSPEAASAIKNKTSAETVTFTLPIDYFCEEEDQKESTQEQLDENSKDGLKYEFDSNGTITCTVTDQSLAQKNVKAEIEQYFKEYQTPEDQAYVKSYQALEYNDDLSEIKIICNGSDWTEYDGWNSLILLNCAHKYQQISGYSREEESSTITFVDEKGNLIFSDELKNYLD